MYKRALALASVGLFALCLLMAWRPPIRSSAAAPGASTVRYVAPAGACGAAAPCYSHPQAAVDAAGEGDEIRIAGGTYMGVISREGTSQAVYVNAGITLPRRLPAIRLGAGSG